eukprot:5890319-Amphidinium_carterae.1
MLEKPIRSRVSADRVHTGSAKPCASEHLRIVSRKNPVSGAWPNLWGFAHDANIWPSLVTQVEANNRLKLSDFGRSSLRLKGHGSHDRASGFSHLRWAMPYRAGCYCCCDSKPVRSSEASASALVPVLSSGCESGNSGHYDCSKGK